MSSTQAAPTRHRIIDEVSATSPDESIVVPTRIERVYLMKMNDEAYGTWALGLLPGARAVLVRAGHLGIESTHGGANVMGHFRQWLEEHGLIERIELRYAPEAAYRRTLEEGAFDEAWLADVTDPSIERRFAAWRKGDKSWRFVV